MRFARRSMRLPQRPAHGRSRRDLARPPNSGASFCFCGSPRPNSSRCARRLAAGAQGGDGQGARSNVRKRHLHTGCCLPTSTSDFPTIGPCANPQACAGIGTTPTSLAPGSAIAASLGNDLVGGAERLEIVAIYVRAVAQQVAPLDGLPLPPRRLDIEAAR